MLFLHVRQGACRKPPPRRRCKQVQPMTCGTLRVEHGQTVLVHAASLGVGRRVCISGCMTWTWKPARLLVR
jgi:hypothetical protein